MTSEGAEISVKRLSSHWRRVEPRSCAGHSMLCPYEGVRDSARKMNGQRHLPTQELGRVLDPPLRTKDYGRTGDAAEAGNSVGKAAIETA